ncbi:MAG: Mov34/MPN/PAD-1 family protein [Solirubrobacterales bacterium]
MKISRELVEEIIAHAREEAPNECCGMVGGEDGTAQTVYRATNAEASPLRYSISAQDLLRITNAIDDAGQQLTAIYHSHTRSPAWPSQTDVNLAFYPDAVYVIVSVVGDGEPEVRCFHIVDGQISEAQLAID